METMPVDIESVEKRSFKRSGRSHRSLRASAARRSAADIPELQTYWRRASSMSARARSSASARKKYREYARLLRDDSPIVCGMLESKASLLIRTGPTLQLTDPTPWQAKRIPTRVRNILFNDENQRQIEIDFKAWCDCIGYAKKLRIFTREYAGDGESFGIMQPNPRVREKTGVSLDIKMIEPDVVDWDEGRMPNRDHNYGGGGIIYDTHDNPVSYPIQSGHPGEQMGFTSAQPDMFDYRQVLHWYRAEKSGQRRGITHLMSALAIIPMMGRMTMATLANVEKSASIAGVLETQADSDGEGNKISCYESEDDWYEAIDIVRGQLLCLANGQQLKEFHGGTPNSQYSTFVDCLINEIARCFNMPFNIANGNSSGYNYASGRLDHQTFFAQVDNERQDIDTLISSRVFDMWLKQYLMSGETCVGSQLGVVTEEEIEGYKIPYKWTWPDIGHVDINKEAEGIWKLMSMGLLSRGDAAARRNQNVDVIDKKNALHLEYVNEDGTADVASYRKHHIRPNLHRHSQCACLSTGNSPFGEADSGDSPNESTDSVSDRVEEIEGMLTNA